MPPEFLTLRLQANYFRIKIAPVDFAYLYPEGCFGLSKDDPVDGITAEQAALLQQIAWQAVQEFQAQK